MARGNVQIEGFERGSNILLKLSRPQKKILRRQVGRALRPVAKRAKQLAPQPGYPGDKPGLTPLRRTIKVSTRTTKTGVTGKVSAKAPHAHLVEFSHRHFAHGEPTGVLTEAQPFMGPAIQDTRQAQDRAVREGILEIIAEARK